MTRFLKTAWRGQSMTADEAERLLNPSAWEFADLLFNTKTGEVWAGIGYILRGVRNVLAWLFWGIVDGVKRATAEPDPLRFSNYRVYDWWHGKGSQSVAYVEEIEAKEGGFPVGFDGQLIRGEGQTRADVKAFKEAEKMAEKMAEITRNEVAIMAAYDPPLHNIALARKVKAYLQEGKTDYEIAALTGYAQATVKHYRLALEKAAKEAGNPSPICPVGEG